MRRLRHREGTARERQSWGSAPPTLRPVTRLVWGTGMGPGLRRVPPTSHQPRLGRADSLSPDSADAARGQRPGHDLRALLHEAPHGEPEAVAQRVLVLQDVGARPQARVRVVPLVGAQPVERHRGWEERGTTGEREGHRDQKRREDTRGEAERHRWARRHAQRQRQERAREEGDRRTRRGQASRGPQSQSQRHREEAQRPGRKGRREGGCREPKTPSGGRDNQDRQKGQPRRPRLLPPPCPLPPRQQVGDSPGGQEQDATDGQIGKKHEEPHSRRERVQEGKVARLAALVGEGVRAESPLPASPKAPGPTGPTRAGRSSPQPLPPLGLNATPHPQPRLQGNHTMCTR